MSSHLFGTNNNDGNNEISTNSNKASVSLSSTITSPPSIQQFNSPTAIIDYFLTLLTSDIGSIVIGSIGLILALCNRLFTVDFDSSISATYAESINIQSRNDLLAVFASGAVLLNGISKLDVTSVLAESVVLNGNLLDQPKFVNLDTRMYISDENVSSTNDLEWAMESILSSTPAKTAVLLTSTTASTNNPSSSWMPILIAGIVPSNYIDEIIIPKDMSTPILDRFLKQENAKESYLPTLQALPGKVEFIYLPDNAQEALLLPIRSKDGKKFALVLGSDTAKSFTPRDVAWSQVLVTRIGDTML